MSESETSDEALMLRFAAGETACFEALVRRYQGPMLNFIGRKIKPRARAEELLQEVFVRVVKSRKRYTVQSKFRTWLYTIARNICVDEIRRRSRRPQTVPNISSQDQGSDAAPRGVDTLKSRGPSPESKTGDQEILARIEVALEQLPEEQREVFVLRQIQGLSFGEIAQVIEISENTVKSRMRYALEKIRVHLSDLSPREEAANPGASKSKVSSKLQGSSRAGQEGAKSLHSASLRPPAPAATNSATVFKKEQLDG